MRKKKHAASDKVTEDATAAASLEEAMRRFRSRDSEETTDREKKGREDREFAERRNAYLDWHKHWDKWPLLRKTQAAEEQWIEDFATFLYETGVLLRSHASESWQAILNGEITGRISGEQFLIELLMVLSNFKLDGVIDQLKTLDEIPPLCDESVRFVLSPGQVFLPRDQLVKPVPKVRTVLEEEPSDSDDPEIKPQNDAKAVDRARADEQKPEAKYTKPRHDWETLKGKVIAEMSDDPDSVGWPQRKWASYLGVPKSTLGDSRVWEFIQRLAVAQKLTKDRIDPRTLRPPPGYKPDTED